MRLAGYVRVSRVAGRGGERFISPEVQRQAIEQAAGRHRVTVWFEDFDQSGGKLERPELERALAAVEARDVDGIAVSHLSRLSRSIVDFFSIVRRLETTGGELIVGDLGLNTSTAAGRLTRNVLLVFAEFELDQARERWHTAKSRAISRGAFVGSTPTGYDRTDEGRLVKNQDADAVREAFRLRARGGSLTAIAALLNERQVKPRKAAQWTSQGVLGLLRVRAYLGETSSGDLHNPKAHEAIVTRAEWEAAQPDAHAPRTAGAYLLTGLARCASCSYSLKVTSRRTGRTYSCRKQHGGGVCPRPAHVTVELLDAHVERVFLEHVREGFTATARARDEMSDAIGQLGAAEAELVAYRDANLVTVIGTDAYREGLAHRQHAIEEASRDLAKLQPVPIIGTAKLADRWPKLNLEHRRELLQAAIDVVAVAPRASSDEPLPERVRVFWRGTGPDNLSRSGRPGVVRPIPFD